MNIQYLKTFEDHLVDLFIDAISDYFKDDYDQGKTIEDWIHQYGESVLGENYKFSRSLRVVLQPYWAPNTKGMVYLIPRGGTDVFDEFVQALDATDIVDITGKSMREMNRKDIAIRGPEFYVMTDELVLPTNLEIYTPMKSIVMAEYSQFFFDNFMKIFLKHLEPLREVRDVVGMNRFYNVLIDKLPNLLNEALRTTKVPKRDNSYRDYKGSEILNIYASESVDPSISSDAYLKKLTVRLNQTIGKDVKLWLVQYLGLRKKFHRDTKRKSTKASLRKYLSDHMIRFLEDGSNLQHKFHQICMGHPNIMEQIGKQIHSHEAVLKNLFDHSMKDYNNCRKSYQLEKKNCEKSMNEQHRNLVLKGLLLGKRLPQTWKESATPLLSPSIIVNEFERRVGTDIRLSKMIHKMNTKQSICLLKKNEPYTMKQHFLTFDRLGSSVSATSKEGHHYTWKRNNNQIQKRGGDSFSVVPHTTGDCPGVTFLIEK